MLRVVCVLLFVLFPHHVECGRNKPQDRDLLQTRASPTYVKRLRDAFSHLTLWAQRNNVDFGRACYSSELMSKLLSTYIQQCYEANESFLTVRHAILSVQWFFPVFVNCLNEPWQALKSWWSEVPWRSRVPIPLKALQLVMISMLMCSASVASHIRKYQYVALQFLCMLGFHGLLRPGELFNLSSRDLMVCYINGRLQLVVSIMNPKTRQWLGRCQHVLIDHQPTCEWAKWFLASLPALTPIWPFGVGTGRKLFRQICASRGFGSNTFTLASLRTGGATYLYQCNQDVTRLQFMGRWANTRTVKIYVQEAISTLVTAKLDIKDDDPVLISASFLLKPPRVDLLSFIGRHGKSFGF